MVEGAVSLIGDVVLPLISAVLEAFVYLLIAVIRLAAYLISRPYRTEVNQTYADRSLLTKWWNLSWGTLLVVGLIIGAFSLGRWTSKPPDKDVRPHRLLQIEKLIIDKALDEGERHKSHMPPNGADRAEP